LPHLPASTCNGVKHSISSTRQAGACLHITSLPGNYGIGEIGAAAREFIDVLSSMNLSVWQILPTGPTGYGDSPYQSLSTFAGNELFIDIDSLIELGLVMPDEASALRDLPRHMVDFGRLIPLKHALLATAADKFESRATSDMQAEFTRFVHDNDEAWLHDYAVYRVSKTMHSEQSWTEWDPALAHRDAAAIRRLESDAARQIARVKLLQFIFCNQWNALHQYAREKDVRLFGDMPIYIALDSADVWTSPELVRMDRDGNMDYVAGVPPDYFSDDGQLWGNPLYDWEYHAAHGFAWWIKRMRHGAARSDLLRLDHFRGLESYWAVPATAETARDGSWQPGPGAEFLDAMQDALGELPIVAEDLGVITPQVESLRERYGIPGMKVLQFEVADRDFDPREIAEDCICYTGTHDNDTAIGWFHGGADDTRTPGETAKTRENVLKLANGSPDTIHTDLIRLAFDSAARLAIAPMQDFLGLGSEARLNTPGTDKNNWRWRLLAEQLTPDLIDSVHELVVASRRQVSG
jgi:4-alpha-glucanotransferase